MVSFESFFRVLDELLDVSQKKKLLLKTTVFAKRDMSNIFQVLHVTKVFNFCHFGDF